MATAMHGWSADGSPALARRERRRTPPGRSERHRSADASAPTAAEKHLAELQARDAGVRASARGVGSAGGGAARPGPANGSDAGSPRRTRSWRLLSAAAARCARATTMSRTASCARCPTSGARAASDAVPTPRQRLAEREASALRRRGRPRARRAGRLRGTRAVQRAWQRCAASRLARTSAERWRSPTLAQLEHGRAAVPAGQAARHGAAAQREQGAWRACARPHSHWRLCLTRRTRARPTVLLLLLRRAQASTLSKINHARQELVTTIRMEIANVIYEQASPSRRSAAAAPTERA
jgi:hypothetical protein